MSEANQSSPNEASSETSADIEGQSASAPQDHKQTKSKSVERFEKRVAELAAKEGKGSESDEEESDDRQSGKANGQSKGGQAAGSRESGEKSPARHEESGRAQASAKKEEENLLKDQDLDRFVKVKINGQEKKITVREALKIQSLEQASRARFEEAAQKEKKVTHLINLAMQDPVQFLELIGRDVDELAEERLAKKYELMQMTPEQRELAQLREQEAQRRAQEEAWQKKQEEEKISHEQALADKKAMEEIQGQFVEAWKESGLPVDPYFGSQVAYEMMSAAKKEQDLSAKDAAAKVKAKFFTQVAGVLQGLDAPTIRQVLGKDVMKKLSDDDLKRLTDNQASQMGISRDPSPAQDAASKPRKQKKLVLNEHEWRDYVRSLAEAST